MGIRSSLVGLIKSGVVEGPNPGLNYVNLLLGKLWISEWGICVVVGHNELKFASFR